MRQKNSSSEEYEVEVSFVRYIAHKDGKREQSVLEHLKGTANLAGSFADRFGKREWGY